MLPREIIARWRRTPRDQMPGPVPKIFGTREAAAIIQNTTRREDR